MGDVTQPAPKTILVTGATGFVGQQVVKTALARGHKVHALGRRNMADLPRGAKGFQSDLSQQSAGLAEALVGVDAVIHLAGSMADDADAQAAQTLAGTQRLLDAIQAAQTPPLLVLVSTIAVYSSAPDLAGTEITEDTPLEPEPEARDAYVAAKLAQEHMCQVAGLPALRILRPGAIYGPGRLWNAHIGFAKAGVLIRLGQHGQIPLTHVSNCTEALVRAAEVPVKTNGAALNLVDDDLPDRSRFLAALDGRVAKLTVPLPWRLLHAVGKMLARVPGRKPGLLRPAVVRARMMPVTYSNARIKAQLAWQPALGFEAGMQDALLAETSK